MPINIPGNLGGTGGYGAEGLWQGPVTSWSGGGGLSLACCYDTEDPEAYVTIGYESLDMDPDEEQNLSVTGYDPECDTSIFTWEIIQGNGTLASGEGDTNILTAPAAGGECVSEHIIVLYCHFVEMDRITVTITPCPVLADISYTTLQMSVDEEQNLSVNVTTPGCGTPTYLWEITSGGGTLSSSSGSSITYTAPSSNAGCTSSPTIKLSCNAVEIDSITIAVNEDAVNDLAYIKIESHPGKNNSGVPSCRCNGVDAGYACGKPIDYNCVGAVYSNPSTQEELRDSHYDIGNNQTWVNKCNGDTVKICAGDQVAACLSGWWADQGFSALTKDVRTQTQKDNGCCPEAMI